MTMLGFTKSKSSQILLQRNPGFLCCTEVLSSFLKGVKTPCKIYLYMHSIFCEDFSGYKMAFAILTFFWLWLNFPTVTV